MNTKIDNPTEVTLEKSTAGVWAAPVAPSRQLKPWQRLWVVTGVVYLLMLAGTFYMLMPTRESIERQMIFSVTEEVRRYDGLAFIGESPRKIFETARTQGYSAWIASVRSKYRIGAEGNAGFRRIGEDCRDALSDLPAKRNLGVLICFVAWLIPMSGFYAIGAGMDWIKRGSRAVKG
jgi:hypothetical protein